MKASFRSSKRSLRRLGTVALAGAMVFALVPAGSALADHTDDHTEVCDAAGPSENFPDVSDSGTHSYNIDCASGYDWITGYDDGQFRPSDEITRGEMAAVIASFVETATGTTLTTDANDDFDDDEGSVFESDIEKLHDNGIISGISEDKFGPALLLTRAQMAVFIDGALDFIDDGDATNNSAPPATTEDAFTDDEGSFAEAEINRLAAADVIQGTSATQFDPSDNVLRGEVTSFAVGGATFAESQDDFAPTEGNEPAGPNQTFTVTPQEDATLDITEEDERQYTASGLDDDTTYDVALVLSDNITVDDNGVVSFDDSAGTADDDEYQPQASANANITVINGSSVNTDATEVSPVNGSIQLTITGTGFAEVTPVVWFDDENDGNIELGADDDDTPAADEPFGIGGSTLFIPNEAPNAGFGPSDVEHVDKDANFFVLADGNRYNYDSGDDLRYDDGTADTTGSAVSFDQFETALSVGDSVSGDYSQDFQSTLEIEADVPGAPESVAVTDVGNLDGGDDNFDATVDWEAPDPANGLVEEYVAEVAPDDSADDDDACTTVGTATTQTVTDTEAQFDNLANGDYCARVRTVSQTDDTAGGAGDPDSVSEFTDYVAFNVQKGDADVTAPTIEDLVFDDASNSGGTTMTATDTITFTFSETMDTEAGVTGIFRFTDADGATFEVDCSDIANATCAFSDSADDVDDVLTVTLGVDGPTHVAGTDDPAGAQINGTVTEFSDEFQDTSGNALDVEGSADTVIDNEF